MACYVVSLEKLEKIYSSKLMSWRIFWNNRKG